MKAKAYIRIHAILSELELSDAIDLIDKIGEEIRQKNRTRITNIGRKDLLVIERPDLDKLKENNIT